MLIEMGEKLLHGKESNRVKRPLKDWEIAFASHTSGKTIEGTQIIARKQTNKKLGKRSE
jgi:hypothetical protein